MSTFPNSKSCVLIKILLLRKNFFDIVKKFFFCINLSVYLNMKSRSQKIIIGRKDKVDFPKLKLFNIDVKIDSGAFTSAIHCKDIKLITRGGKKYIKFTIPDSGQSDSNKRAISLPLLKEKKIKNSFGQSERRYVVVTEIFIFNRKYEIELSLADRSKMKYPVLIGRNFLQGRFLIDLSRVNVSYREKLKFMDI